MSKTNAKIEKGSFVTVRKAFGDVGLMVLLVKLQVCTNYHMNSGYRTLVMLWVI